jgi:hypothetical protein
MISILIGFAVFALAGLVFVRCMPDQGKLYRFAGTEWEAYVGVAFCSAFALSFTMILSGLIDRFG